MLGSKREITRRRLYPVAFLVLIVLACIGIRQFAAADDTLLQENQKTVYAGDTVVLQDYVREEYREGVRYQWERDVPDPSVAELAEDGKIQTASAGQVRIRVSCTLESGETKEEIFELTMKTPEQLSMEYGSELDLEAEEMYGAGVLQYTSSADSVLVSEQGRLNAQGFQSAQITASKEDGTSFVAAVVTILEPVLEKSVITRAAGTSAYQPDITYFTRTGTAENIEWQMADETIASWDASGCHALKQGSTQADIILTAKNGEQKTLSAHIIVTDPKLSAQKVILAAKTNRSIHLTGIDDTSSVTWEDQTSEAAYFSEPGTIYGSSKGKVTLQVTADGRTLECRVTVTDPGYADLTVILYKGQAKKLKLRGLADGSAVSYTSSNKKRLTISKSGRMKAKKTGHVKIRVKADGRKLTILAEISSKKGYRAMKKAIAISGTKTKYSQARRMSKGYYDCSSLVSRVYRKYGIYFGRRRGWSPTAASIAKWCAKHHKVVARKAVSYQKLLPGDLIFFSGWKNGRYRNITHVEMYTGGATDVSASSRYHKVVHYGYSRADNIVMIARPAK